jgi:hypothetical protein
VVVAGAAEVLAAGAEVVGLTAVADVGAVEVVAAGAVVVGVVAVPELHPDMMKAQTKRTSNGI